MSEPTAEKKSSTRSSIRHSLNLASVGKAFADVINKDASKKTKDSRRSSLANPIPTPRLSMDSRPPSQVSKRTGTPDSKTVTRRRVSASLQRSSSDEQPPKSAESTTPQSAVAPKSTTLRPRNLNAASALPKYRPKSAIVEIEKPPSPVRVGTRRRLSNSDDEKKEQKRPQSSDTFVEDKFSRPISPLPHRAALKANLTNAINATPPVTPSKTKDAVRPSSAKASPTRPAKLIKTIAAVPRPPSSTTSSTSLSKVSSPKVSTPKSASKVPFYSTSSRSTQETARPNATPSGRSPLPPSRDTPSPLAHRSRISKSATPSISSGAGNMSHISEANSEDDEEDDVELLLAPVAALGAPTPAMPRIHLNRKRLIPQTPTRSSGLPSRANLSYVSPQPPGQRASSLRPPQIHTDVSRAPRGSIMSWEQLANDASKTLGEDELGRMLSEIPAPFRSGAASPSLDSQIDIPESPCLSAMDSPGGYGSISQVLLPDVTPSPAMNILSLQQSRFSLSPDTSTADSSAITLLRLQLASAENQARERLFQMQAMEEEIHNLKQAHTLQMEETEKQMVYMEGQHRQASESRSNEIVILRNELEQTVLGCQQEVERAVIGCREAVMDEAKRRFVGRCSASVAASKWGAVRSICQIEMETLQGDRAVLSVLLAQLDVMRSVL